MQPQTGAMLHVRLNDEGMMGMVSTRRSASVYFAIVQYRAAS